MTTTLTHPTVAAFVTATNAADGAALTALFGPDAVVTDHGMVFDEPVAIAAWIADEVVGARIVLDPVECTDDQAPTLVADADGEFSSGMRGPIRFELRFTLEGASIARLDIRPLH